MDQLHDQRGSRAAADSNLLSVCDAQRMIEQCIEPLAETETIALLSALGRVLAHDINSPISVPSHDNAAMDGFALRGVDIQRDAVTSLQVIGTSYAGRPWDAAPLPGQCIRIMTGAVMPDGCDTVVAQEHCAQIGQDRITIAPHTLAAGDNRRLAGEDLMAGQPALARGRVIGPADLGLLASLGIATVTVTRRLRVAFFSSGDELRAIGQQLDAGCVYDSNRYTLFGMLTRLGCEVVDLGIVSDQPQALEVALRRACHEADAIVTSGGMCDGAADYTRQVVAQLGDITFCKINMRPGRPLAFGRITADGNSAFLFGLPGNPVAVMASFYFIARAGLLRMMGAEAPLEMVKVKSAAAISKKPGRTEFQRGIVATDSSGSQTVRLTGSQGSGILSSMTQANCMLVLLDQQGNVGVGELVDIIPFAGLI